MRILAIDTALPAVSACVLDHDAAAPIAAESVEMERGHAEALLPLIRRIMAKVDGGFASLDRIAVTVGPGSFTGIRIGLAAGQAIALACKAEIVGVSTLAALAAPLIINPFDGVVAAAIDARHDKIYIAAFGPGGRPLLTARRMNAPEALRALGAGPLLLTGSGAPLLAKEARARGVPVRVASERLAPDIALVARLGLAAQPDTAPARPLYLKEPDVTMQNPRSDPQKDAAALGEAAARARAAAAAQA
ncbi:MAG: tRNA (adenosine(37)-N6)-threonylcarbamoyltransferase complex dimerization subunit type 1 TsaB [Methylocystis sp.]|nr:tRNA (adenosine(37)-N6)-threonylcarbamoyltransferase complex dimerization subunit type 1 TsaB [Methylocystis sp.]